MSHGDQLSKPPPDFHIIGHTKSAPFAAVAHKYKPIYGIQFHLEVTHTPSGKSIIGKFIRNVCGCRPNWTMVMFRHRLDSQMIADVFIIINISLGGIYRKGDFPYSRNMWDKGACDRCCEWRSRQHCCC
jgi:hypothetical protein